MSPLSRASRIAWATLLAAAAAVLVGPALMRVLAPAIGVLTDLAVSDVLPEVRVDGDGLAARIVAGGTMVAALPVSADAYVPILTQAGPVSFSMAHALVPLTIVLALLLVWPWRDPREALWRAMIGLPAVAAMIAILAAAHLAGLLDTVLWEARRGALTGDLPATVRALLFLESGGRWLMPLVAGLVCVALARHAAAPRRPRGLREPLDERLMALAAQARGARDANPPLR